MAKLILIIEDDPDLASAMAEALAAEGYQVATASNGQEALAALSDAVHPALILLDMMMPAMDGWALLHWLQRDAVLSSVPVVVMTAYGIGGVGWAAGLGARGYLRKPFDTDALLQEIRRCLESPTA